MAPHVSASGLVLGLVRWAVLLLVAVPAGAQEPRPPPAPDAEVAPASGASEADGANGAAPASGANRKADDTETVESGPENPAGLLQGNLPLLDLCRFLAFSTGLPVIVDASQPEALRKGIALAAGAGLEGMTTDLATAVLKEHGFTARRVDLPGGATVLTVEPEVRGKSEPLPLPEGVERKLLRIPPRSPALKGKKVTIAARDAVVLDFLQFLADYTGLDVQIDAAHGPVWNRIVPVVSPMKDVNAEITGAVLSTNRFSVKMVNLPEGGSVLNVEPLGVRAPGSPAPVPRRGLDSRLDDLERKLDLVLSQVEALRAGTGGAARTAAGTAGEPLRYRGRSVEEWVLGLGDRDPLVAEEAIRALAAMGDDTSPSLREALTSPDRVVRRHAVRALSRLGGCTGRFEGMLLLKMLADRDVSVRTEAARALGLAAARSVRALSPAPRPARRPLPFWVGLKAAWESFLEGVVEPQVDRPRGEE